MNEGLLISCASCRLNVDMAALKWEKLFIFQYDFSLTYDPSKTVRSTKNMPPYHLLFHEHQTISWGVNLPSYRNAALSTLPRSICPGPLSGPVCRTRVRGANAHCAILQNWMNFIGRNMNLRRKCGRTSTNFIRHQSTNFREGATLDDLWVIHLWWV